VSGSELGATVKSYIDAGHLVPHAIIMKVVKEAVLQYPPTQKLLFDGIPRDADQKKDFDAIMRDAGRDFRCVHLLLTRAQGIERILGRARVEGRADDADLSAINRRMDTFEAKTLPVIAEYATKGIVTELDGNRSVDDVYGDLRSIAQSM
jgi:adenylate kinase